jgi:hypothetical protein
LFFSWLGEPASILELGSLEGGHTVELAKRPSVERVLGLEARIKNIRRAELVSELLGSGSISFVQADLDKSTLGRFGHFDAVFCAGLLYHLTRPWRLLQEITNVTNCVFLDTQYSERDEICIEGYVGSLYAEGSPDNPSRHSDSDVISGLSDSSFWMTLPCLIDTLNREGFSVQHHRVIPDWEGFGPRVHLAATRD